MWPFRSDRFLARVHADLRSPDAAVRGHALEDLLQRARRPGGPRPAALATFREVVAACVREGAACAEEPWPLRAAARGMQALARPLTRRERDVLAVGRGLCALAIVACSHQLWRRVVRRAARAR